MGKAFSRCSRPPSYDDATRKSGPAALTTCDALLAQSAICDALLAQSAAALTALTTLTTLTTFSALLAQQQQQQAATLNVLCEQAANASRLRQSIAPEPTEPTEPVASEPTEPTPRLPRMMRIYVYMVQGQQLEFTLLPSGAVGRTQMHMGTRKFGNRIFFFRKTDMPGSWSRAWPSVTDVTHLDVINGQTLLFLTLHCGCKREPGRLRCQHGTCDQDAEFSSTRLYLCPRHI